jgi:RecA/RadA recombinase
MSIDKSNLGYLGKDFQNKFIWQLLTNQNFGLKIIDDLDASYIDDNYLKRIVVLYIDYYKQHNKIASLLNHSITETVNERITNEIEKTTITTILKKAKRYHEKVFLNQIPDDGDVVQSQVWEFIKQQKYIKLAKKIISNTAEGKLELISEIEEDLQSIQKIGIEIDYGQDLEDNIDETVESDYRNPIPTGIKGLDDVMGGGLGNGEMGFILAPTGTGKTTMLTLIANHAFSVGKNVLHIFFEDTYPQIRRKYCTAISEIGLRDFEENKDFIKTKFKEHLSRIKAKHNNKLTLVKFPQDDNKTIPFIKKFIKDLQGIKGVRYDMIVLDYIDCLVSHIPNRNDELANELTVIKSFEAMLSELDVAGWSAFQGNRQSIGAEKVGFTQLGGSIKKAQKTHFTVSIAKTDMQKEEKKANISVLKSRFGIDGITFENSLFDNENMKIILNTENTTAYDFLNGIDKSNNVYDTETKHVIDNQAGLAQFISNLS